MIDNYIADQSPRITMTLSEILANTPPVQTLAQATDVPGTNLEWMKTADYLTGAWFGDLGELGTTGFRDSLFTGYLALGVTCKVSGVPYSWGGAAWVAVGGDADKLIVSGPIGVASLGDSTATLLAGSAYDWPSKIIATIPSTGSTMLSPNPSSMIGNSSRGWLRYIGDLGIGGTDTASILARGAASFSPTRKALQDVAKLYNLKLVIVRAGSINDIAATVTTSTPDSVIYQGAARHCNIIRKILAMGFWVVDCAIYGYDGSGGNPSPENLAAVRRAITLVNTRIQESLSSLPRYRFVASEGVVGVSGAYIPGMTSDGTHLSPAGVGAWEKAETSAVLSMISGSPDRPSFSDYDKLWLTPSAGVPSTVTVNAYGGSTPVSTTADGILSIALRTNGIGSGVRVFVPIVPQLTAKLSGEKFFFGTRIECYDAEGNAYPADISSEILAYSSDNAAYFYYHTSGIVAGVADSISQTIQLDRDAGVLGSLSRIQINVYPQAALRDFVIKIYPPQMYADQ